MQSMEEIYRQHAQTVYRYLLAQTRSADLAEELTQETFYQAVRTAGSTAAKENSPHGSAVLQRTSCAPISAVIRLRKSWMKRRPLRIRRMKRFSAHESQLELLRKMQTLGSDAREVMYLRIFGTLSFRDIGEILSRTENWARVTYYRGREALRKELEKDDEK